MRLRARVLGLFYLCGCVGAHAEVGVLGAEKLFLSAEEVLAAEQKKRSYREQVAQQHHYQHDVTSETVTSFCLRYDAFVYHQQHAALWINGQLIEQNTNLAGIEIHPNRLTADGRLRFYHQGRWFSVYPGQYYCLNDGRVMEGYTR